MGKLTKEDLPRTFGPYYAHWSIVARLAYWERLGLISSSSAALSQGEKL